MVLFWYPSKTFSVKFYMIPCTIFLMIAASLLSGVKGMDSRRWIMEYSKTEVYDTLENSRANDSKVGFFFHPFFWTNLMSSLQGRARRDHPFTKQLLSNKIEIFRDHHLTSQGSVSKVYFFSTLPTLLWRESAGVLKTQNPCTLSDVNGRAILTT